MLRFVMVAGLVLQAAGCASAGQSGAAGSTTRLERDVGTGNGQEVVDKSLKILRQHLFEVLRQEAAPNLYIETHWRNRSPFADEMATGVVRAQTRAIVRGQPRSTTTLGVNLYAVNLTIENRVQRSGVTRDSDTWDPTLATADYRKFAERITQDLTNELNVGVRR